MTLSRANFYGGAIAASISADYRINPGVARMYTISSTAGPAVVLPNALRMRGTGGPYFWIYNNGANDFDVETMNGIFVRTIPAGFASVVLLSDDSTEDGIWHIDPRLPNISVSSSPGSPWASGTDLQSSAGWSGTLSGPPA